MSRLAPLIFPLTLFFLLILSSPIHCVPIQSTSYSIGVLCDTDLSDLSPENAVSFASYRFSHAAEVAMMVLNEAALSLSPTSVLPIDTSVTPHRVALLNLTFLFTDYSAVPQALTASVQALMGGNLCLQDETFEDPSSMFNINPNCPPYASAVSDPVIGLLDASQEDDFTNLVAPIAGAFSRPFMSGVSSGDTFSVKMNYPFGLRTVPSYSSIAHAYIDFFLSVGWTQAAFFYDEIDFAENELSALQADIQSRQLADPSFEFDLIPFPIPDCSVLSPEEALSQVNAGVQSILQSNLDLRIIIIPEDQNFIYPLLQVLPKFGISGEAADVNGKTTFQPNNSPYVVASFDLRSGYALFYTEEMHVQMAGFLGITVAHPLGEAWTEFNDTLATTGAIPEISSTGPILDLSYLSYGEVPLTTLEAQIYDAVVAYGYGIRILHEQGFDVFDKKNFTGADLYSAMLLANFNGSTGNVQFLSDGDRLGSFDLLNVNQFGALETIAVYTATSASDTNVSWNFQPTGGEVSSIFWLNGLSSVGAQGYIPTDRPVTTIDTISSSYTIGFVAVSIVLMILCVLLSLFLYIHRRYQIIRASNILFCQFILLGCLFGFLSIIFLSYDPYYYPLYSCTLFPLFLEIGFDFSYGSLFIKTWQINSIFNQRHLVVKKNSQSTLIGMLIALLTMTAIVHGCMNGLDQPFAAQFADPSREYSVVYSCTTDNMEVWYVLILVPKGILLMIGAVLAFRVRNVGDNFNESKYVAASIYQIVVLASLIFLLRNLLGHSIVAVFAITAILTLVAVLDIMILIFASKVWRVFNIDKTMSAATGTTGTEMMGSDSSWSQNTPPPVIMPSKGNQSASNKVAPAPLFVPKQQPGVSVNTSKQSTSPPQSPSPVPPSPSPPPEYGANEEKVPAQNIVVPSETQPLSTAIGN